MTFITCKLPCCHTIDMFFLVRCHHSDLSPEVHVQELLTLHKESFARIRDGRSGSPKVMSSEMAGFCALGRRLLQAVGQGEACNVTRTLSLDRLHKPNFEAPSKSRGPSLATSCTWVRTWRSAQAPTRPRALKLQSLVKCELFSPRSLPKARAYAQKKRNKGRRGAVLKCDPAAPSEQWELFGQSGDRDG